jgi:hypothetical protein
MKTKTLTIITGALLLAGSAALYAMSVKVDVSDEGTGRAGRSVSPAAPPAFSVVVTSHRATPGYSVSGARSRSRLHGAGWTPAPTTGDRWGEVRPDPRS